MVVMCEGTVLCPSILAKGLAETKASQFSFARSTVLSERASSHPGLSFVGWHGHASEDHSCLIHVPGVAMSMSFDIRKLS